MSTTPTVPIALQGSPLLSLICDGQPRAATSAPVAVVPVPTLRPTGIATAGQPRAAAGASEDSTKAEYERIFREMNETMAALKGNIEKHSKLLAEVQAGNGTIFDAQDEQVVLNEIAQMRAQLQALEADYQKRMHTYENVLLVLREVMQGRQKKLEDLDRTTGILSTNDSLRRYFVGKQADLKKMHQEMCTKLSSAQ